MTAHGSALDQGSSFHRSPFNNRTTSRTSRARRNARVRPDDAVGHFSLGPATQTTVVTTTTTTTTEFPPLVLRASRQPTQLDPKQYPLSQVSTPASLRVFTFQHEGKQVMFREAADATIALEEHLEEQDKLQKGGGMIKRIHHMAGSAALEIDPRRPSSRLTNDEPASPESIEDDVEMEDRDAESPVSLSFSHHGTKQIGLGGKLARRHPRLGDFHTANITPASLYERSLGHTRRRRRSASQHLTGGHNVLPSPDTDHHIITMQPTVPATPQEDSFEQEIARRVAVGRSTTSRTSHETSVPTPPIEPEDGFPVSRTVGGRALSSVPSRLHMSDGASTHDGTLPSPSLSPVTAAAANAPIHGYFNDISSGSDTLSRRGRSMSLSDHEFVTTPSHGEYDSPAATEYGGLEDRPKSEDAVRFTGSSIADIPAMLDFFEVMPDELKSYVIHQLLRRCPKPTLHVVAEAVNPALKCDFLTMLPPELALNVLGYLDVRTLCRAAQVSRRWRHIVNSDEKVWKERFDADGFMLPEGELQAAITQGWGWQDPHGIEGHELDLSSSSSVKAGSEAGSPGPSAATPRKISSGILRRSKRKAATLLSGRKKQMKRLERSREVSADLDSVEWTPQMSTAEGPYNAATAAVIAVPNPKLDLPGLKGLHLYKSLYRRHHLIRRNWMLEETKPRHIAFRAHDSHVVTCLQFDTEKILTGSDDNNINVYDTRTGKLKQLLRGHEGGVWALQYQGNTLVSGSTDRSVRVWDIENGRETQVFRGHTSTVRCLQIVTPTKVGETPDGKDILMPKQPLIITGSRDSTLRVWKLPRPEDPIFIQAESDAESDDCPYFVRTLTGHQHSVRAIAAHADTLVSGSYDCTVRVWKVSTGETVHRLQGHGQKVYSVVLDHSRNRCISGSMDNLVKIWSLDTGSALYTLEGHSSLVGLLDLNCDRLVSAAADSTLRIWDPDNGQCKATLSAHTGAITCFQHDGQKVISGSDRTLKMWNTKTGECMKDLLSDLSGVWQVKFNERRCVAAVQRDNMTYIEVLDFGASRDGIPESQRGHRIVVDAEGKQVEPAPEEEYGYAP